MAAKSTFLDTNVLVYRYVIESPFHAIVTRRMDELQQSGSLLFVSPQTITELCSALTRHFHSSKFDAVVEIVQRISQEFEFLIEDLRVSEGLCRIVTKHQVIGRQVHDANIVATMLVHEIPNLLTNNETDFRRYASLINVLPLLN